MSRKLTLSFCIHFLLGLGLLIYFKALFNDFVWDDKTIIVDYKAVHTFDLIKIFTSSGEAKGQADSLFYYYRPLLYVYYAIIYSFSGLLPFFYHLFQISIHIINAVFILLLFRKIFQLPLAFL